MAGKVGPIVGHFAKWLVVPIVFGLIGYFVIGPRIGGAPVESEPTFPETISQGGTVENWKQFSGEPEVSVQVAKPVKKSSFSRRPKKREAPVEPPAVPDSPQVNPDPEPPNDESG